MEAGYLRLLWEFFTLSARDDVLRNVHAVSLF